MSQQSLCKAKKEKNMCEFRVHILFPHPIQACYGITTQTWVDNKHNQSDCLAVNVCVFIHSVKNQKFTVPVSRYSVCPLYEGYIWSELKFKVQMKLKDNNFSK